MKGLQQKSRLAFWAFSLLALITLGACSDDEDSGPALTGNSVQFTLDEVGGSGVSGAVTFAELDNGATRITINLSGTSSSGLHPSHIHFNTVVEGGGIAVSLTDVDGASGSSVTEVTARDDGSSVSYEQLADYNGYINIHNSADDLGTILAQGDIGQNALTGESKTYDLLEKDVDGISGTATFEQRQNGTTLVTLNLTGTPAGGEHPAHIHENEAAVGGGIAVSLTPVDGDTGVSQTQVSQLDDGTSITFTGLLDYNGYINVHLSANELSTIVAQGNIGSNEGKSIGGAANYDVTNSGASAYIFNGNGLTNESNPDFTLQRGMTYTFTVNTPGHPFLIKSVQSTGTGDTYNDGVTNNGATSDVITFTVPASAPNTLFYNCEFHSSMTGTITITD